jgi:DNA-binding MarR family transcriptional regulator
MLQMPAKRNVSKRTVAELVAQLGRMTYGESFANGLTPAQWTALRYFSRANRFSRTMSAFAEFHATTRGTASQTIKSLAQSGYLTRKRSKTDGRSVHFNLTHKSKKMLSDDPFEALVGAAGTLSESEYRTVARSLERMLCKLAQQEGKRLFGMCTNCNYFQKDDSSQKGESGYICTLMDEPLEEAEIEQLCVSFQPVQ